MSGFAFRLQLPRSRSWALKIELWNGISFSSETPKSPMKQVVLQDERTLVTKPSPRTTKLLGSVTSVELFDWSTSTPGASSSAIWTSTGFGFVDSPCLPAT